MKFSILLSLLAFFGFHALGQKQNHQWRYGSTGISFNTNPPSQVQGAALTTGEGSASVADRNTGELLFYTDGVTVWNRQNQVMQNGTMLRGGSAALLSSTTAAVIVPKPGSENFYYIITVDEGSSGSGSGGIRYNLVDMTLDGGLGGIVASQKNVFLYQTGTERLEVVPAANGTDLWVVTHNNASFVAFRLKPNGFEPNPVQSQVSGNLFSNTAGHLKINRQFNVLACGSLFEGRIRLFNFNNATGVVSDRISFGLSPFLNTSPLIYGLEFSPGGRFLYASNLINSVQYDVSLATQQAIENSAFLLNSGGASIQLGPDQKIYINNGSLNVITCPDKPGSQCGFNPGTLAGGGYGLPKWVYYPGDSVFAAGGNAILFRDSCLGANTQFSLRNNAGFSAVSWNFGDPASGAANSGSGTETSHVFSGIGDFDVRAILTTDCGFDTVFLEFSIRSCSLPCNGEITLSGDSCLQTDFTFGISGPEIVSVKWDFGDPGSGTADSSRLVAPVHRFSSAGEFLVRAVVNFSCGKDTLEIPVLVKDCSLPVCSASIETQVLDSCLGDVAFSTTSGDPILLQSWDFGDSASGNLNSSSKNNPIHRFSGSGNYKVRLVALLACGLDTVEKEISIKLCEKPVCEIRIPNAITPNGDDRNDVFLPQSNCAFLEYELSILNRWGKLIYSGNQLADWPGSRNAADSDPAGDVYFYTLRWRFDGEAAQKKSGFITLLR